MVKNRISLNEGDLFLRADMAWQDATDLDDRLLGARGTSLEMDAVKRFGTRLIEKRFGGIAEYLGQRGDHFYFLNGGGVLSLAPFTRPIGQQTFLVTLGSSGGTEKMEVSDTQALGCRMRQHQGALHVSAREVLPALLRDPDFVPSPEFAEIAQLDIPTPGAIGV